MKNLSQTFSATGTGATLKELEGHKDWTFEADVTAASGAVSATVIIEGTGDAAGLTGWYTLATLSPSGTTTALDAITGRAVPICLRSRVTAISAATTCVVRFSGAR